jgi:hypothetical protein
VINHARTLLGNRDVAAYVSSFWPVPAEIVDGGFRPIPLSATLAAVDQALFGADPDPTMLTSRLAMLTDWLDHPVLAPYVLALDPRISYRHGDPSLFERLTFGTRFQYLVGDRMEVPGLLRGTEPSPDATGRCDFSWRLERTAEDEGTIFSEVPRGTLVTVDPAVLQPLPFSQHQVQLNLIP